jgi:predicted nucleotidyltransferase
MRLAEHTRDAILRHLSVLEPAVVYLFGSFGTSRQHPGSDLDLAILAVAPLDPVSLFRLGGEISTALNREVDLIDLSTASTVMAKEVLRTGERLFTADLNVAREFEMRALSDYARPNEERRPIIAR